MLRTVALAATVVLLFGVSSVGALAQRLNSNIDYIDVDALLGDPPPADPGAGAPTKEPDPVDPNQGQALNILVLGSDQRDGENGVIGGEDPSMASDTTIVVHVSADRSRVELVSIPRDSLVDIPSCLASNGKTTRAETRSMFNRAFSIGWQAGGDLVSAAACTGRTVQQNTGLQIDHFVVVDFVGFQSMVNAVDGVDICIPEAMRDTYIPLNLQAGQQTLDGYQALQFARSRHNNVGNGSDLDRIGNQQRLIAALVNQVLSRDVLTNPAKITGFLSAATSSLTVDNGLSLVDMTGLAYSMRSIRSNDIVFMTIPVGAAPENPNRVVWTSKAKDIWANMAADQPVAPGVTVPVGSSTGDATTGTQTPADGATQGTTGTQAPASPQPGQTREAGKEAFTGADTTAVCS